ncbi:MAG: hypothetical protein U0234_15460 [Sandaracinus sp.]
MNRNRSSRAQTSSRAQSSRAQWLVALAVFSLSLGMLATSFVPEAGAQRLRATVFVTQASIPRGLTEKALIGFARGHQARQMQETTETELAQRHWLGNMVVQFNSPPGDLEYHALFYDITDGTRNFIDDMAIYVHDRDQRTYVQRLNLARPRFRPNRRLEMVVTVAHAEVGNTRLELRGEEERRSGQVDFSEADTHAAD